MTRNDKPFQVDASQVEAPIPRTVRRISGAMVLGIAAWFLACGAPILLNLRLPPMEILLSTIAVGFMSTLIYIGLAINHAWKRIKDANLALCTYCEYPLAGLETTGRCPECGQPYDIEDVRARWAFALASGRLTYELITGLRMMLMVGLVLMFGLTCFSVAKLVIGTPTFPRSGSWERLVGNFPLPWWAIAVVAMVILGVFVLLPLVKIKSLKKQLRF